VIAKNGAAMRQIWTLRFIWLALILSQIVGIAVIDSVAIPHRRGVIPNPNLIWMNIAILVLTVPMTFGMRAQLFRRTEINGRVPAKVYFTTTILFWAACDMVSTFGMVTAVVNGTIYPSIIFVAIGVSLQSMTFPNGSRISG
jgi:hypothetical protein